jgi:hypothetical protein
LSWLVPESTLPVDLLSVVQRLQAEASRGRIVLSDGSLVTSTRPTQEGVLALQHELQRMAAQSGRAWALANRGPGCGYQLLVFKQAPCVLENADWSTLVGHLISALEPMEWLLQPPAVSKSLVEVCFSMRAGRRQAEVVALFEQILPWRGS